MTPKEKAEQLYINYLATVRFTMEDCSFTYRGDDYELHIRKTAKACALIAVDEILLATGLETKGMFEFYFEVKQEIEKL